MNVREELIEHIENRDVEFVSVVLSNGFDTEFARIKGTLPEVLPRLDLNYFAGFGSQKLFGYIWYSDGSWSERAQYDGSEWWEHKARPSWDVEISI